MVTAQVIPLLAHDCVAVVLESSCISIYAAVLRSSRLVLGQNRSDLSSYKEYCTWNLKPPFLLRRNEEGIRRTAPPPIQSSA